MRDFRCPCRHQFFLTHTLVHVCKALQTDTAVRIVMFCSVTIPGCEIHFDAKLCTDHVHGRDQIKNDQFLATRVRSMLLSTPWIVTFGECLEAYKKQYALSDFTLDLSEAQEAQK